MTSILVQSQFQIDTLKTRDQHKTMNAAVRNRLSSNLGYASSSDNTMSQYDQTNIQCHNELALNVCLTVHIDIGGTVWK